MDGRHRVDETSYFVTQGGSGPPVLLLHGFPETHACWHRVAPRLAENRRVIAPDLRGYGASEAPPGGPLGEGYTKREMAAELVALMTDLGHEQFAVVGHDRGGRVVYRLALDHPERVTRAALLNVVSTVDQFERMGAGPSLGYWTWYLLAQPAPFPERMLLAEPAALLDHVFATWPSDPGAIGPEQREAYLRALTPSTADAMCADFRASFGQIWARRTVREARLLPCRPSQTIARRCGPTTTDGRPTMTAASRVRSATSAGLGSR